MSKRCEEEIQHKEWPPPPKSRRHTYSLSWEDEQCAGLTSLTCGCGVTTDYTKCDSFDFKLVSAGDIVECPECGDKYKAYWGGMELRKVEEEYVPHGTTLEDVERIKKELGAQKEFFMIRLPTRAKGPNPFVKEENR